MPFVEEYLRVSEKVITQVTNDCSRNNSQNGFKTGRTQYDLPYPTLLFEFQKWRSAGG